MSARSFDKKSIKTFLDFGEWRVGFLASLAKDNIPVKQMPDGSIVAKLDGFWSEMKPDLQQENYEEWVRSLKEFSERREKTTPL